MSRKNEIKIGAGIIGMGIFLTAARVFAQATPEPAKPLAVAIQSDGPNILYAMFAQMLNNPSSLLVIAFLCVVNWLVDDLPFIPSKYVKHCSVVTGASIFWMFTSRDAVPSYYPHPLAVFFANGTVCGFIAFAAHKKVTMRVINFFESKQSEKKNEEPKNK